MAIPSHNAAECVATDAAVPRPAISDLERVIRIDQVPAGRGVLHCYLNGDFIAPEELSLCRMFEAEGICGVIETWREGASYPSMRIAIAAGAKLAVSETNGPRFVKYRPFPTDERLPLNRHEAQADLSARGVCPSG